MAADVVQRESRARAARRHRERHSPVEHLSHHRHDVIGLNGIRWCA